MAASLYGHVTAKATQMGAILHAVGGTEDHLHLVVSVAPTMAISEFVGQVKGSSSHFMNHTVSLPTPFAWQAEYGIVSFDRRKLGRIMDYVKSQRQHHAEQTTIPALERVVQ